MSRCVAFPVGLACVALIALFTGCDEDPPPDSEEGAWEVVSLQDAPARGILRGVAFSGSEALAVGAGTAGVPPAVNYEPFVAERVGDTNWRRVTGSWLPAAGLLTAVGFAPAGDAIIAGFDLAPPGQGFVLDERGGWSRVDVSLGVLAMAQSGGVIRLAGSPGLLVSPGADAWTPESLPFPATTNERGLVDIAARNGVWAACGFDDGAEGTPESPYHVVFLNGGAGWQRLELPCGGCGNREFRAVAVSATGGVLLGGAITNFQGGAADEYVAFLLVRSAGGDWVEIVLPAAGELDRVNDILVTTDGTVYLACGMGGVSRIVRSPTGGPAVREASFEDARIESLAEGPGGAIHAVGARFAAGNPDLPSPALWRRAP